MKTKTILARITSAASLLPLLLLLAPTATVQAQDYDYTTNDGTITITHYNGPDTDVTIPDTIDGLPVTSIGFTAFIERRLTSVTIPHSVT
ncbi:MAG: fibronectin type III domain-containing protein, partial [Verrucomicrobia bacterium]|nr:fibronectin type III domain-containing protein [Verrucomicrobiota bacterium]